jgi:polyhydroxyalkanoate synthesis regulator phasin
LPDFGQILGISGSNQHSCRVMSEVTQPSDELVDQVSRTTGLTTEDARRVVADVLAYFTETTEEYVRRRHRELQTYGARNDEIFARLGDELRHWPVRSPELSARQLRRIVYG